MRLRYDFETERGWFWTPRRLWERFIGIPYVCACGERGRSKFWLPFSPPIRIRVCPAGRAHPVRKGIPL